MSLLKSSATVSALTLVSRITGVIRDMLIARYFGASAETDAFYAAFRLPNMLRRLFAEGAFQQAFVPMEIIWFVSALTNELLQAGRRPNKPL